MDETTDALILAALAFADTLEWDISDGGHAGVRSDYDLASDLFDAVNEYKKAHDIPLSKSVSEQSAIRGLASLVRR